MIAYPSKKKKKRTKVLPCKSEDRQKINVKYVCLYKYDASMF